jgi:hypothetical protein
MEDTEETTYDAQSLLAELGPATDAELEEHFAGSEPATLVEWGATVATPRIERDGWRIIGQARDFLAHASPQQLDHLAAISRETLRLAAHAVARAEELYELQDSRHRSTSEKASERQAQVSSIREGVVAHREVLFGLVRSVAGGTEPLRTRILESYNKAQDPATLAATLNALCDIGDQLLASKDPGVAKRLKSTRLRKELLDGLRTEAQKAQQAADQQDKINAAPVTRAQVDLHDGYSLSLLQDIVDAFERAHHADTTIPRIVLYTLRNVLRPPRGKKAPKAAPEPTTGKTTP